MAEGQYPVQWGEKTLYMHDATVSDKEAFVAWAKRWEGREQLAIWGDVPNVLNGVLAAVPSLIWWADVGMSDLCGKIITCPAGDTQFNRILFGDSAKGLSDGDLQKLIDAKTKEQNEANAKYRAMNPDADEFPPANDYYLALRSIKEASDPKA